MAQSGAPVGPQDTRMSSKDFGIREGEVATLLGINPEGVTLHPQLIGGSFGRRLTNDFILEAVEVAHIGADQALFDGAFSGQLDRGRIEFFARIHLMDSRWEG